MKKKVLVLLLTIALVIFSTFTAFASSAQLTEVSILVDGKIMDATNYGMYTSKDGIAMYPLRLIAESLGAEVSWEASTNRALITTPDRDIWLNPTTGVVTVNGVNKQLKYNVEVKNSRIHVPAEFINDIVGARFGFDNATKTISLQKPAETIETLDLSDSEQNVKSILAAYLTSYELHRNFSGQILVVKDGKVLIHRAYGYADYENQIKAFNTTTFGIGSVTKQFTAAAIMQLAERNKLSYDDLVSKFLPDVPFADQITIHQLLTHTSGLYEYTNMLPSLVEQSVALEEMTFEKLIELIGDQPLAFEPGSNFTYCNTNYLILGKIIEVLSGRSLESYLEENIFIPAGMKNTGAAFILDQKMVEANGYSGHMEVVHENTFDRVLLNIAYGAGYLASTVEDLYRWNQALQSGDIVSMESLEKMFGRATDMNLLVPYAYGWMLNRGEYGEEIFHGGNLIGYTALNALFPEKKAQIIILTNKGYADLTSIYNSIVSILQRNAVSPLEELIYASVSEEQMSKYVGTYDINGIIKFDLFIKDGKLMLQAEQQIAVELEPLSQTKFESAAFGIAVEFHSTDVPTELIFHQAGVQIKAEKIK